MRKFRFREIDNWPKITHLVKEEGINVDSALSDSTVYLLSLTLIGVLVKNSESQASAPPPEQESKICGDEA